MTLANSNFLFQLIFFYEDRIYTFFQKFSKIGQVAEKLMITFKGSEIKIIFIFKPFPMF